jgi:hypothetical protein
LGVIALDIGAGLLSIQARAIHDAAFYVPVGDGGALIRDADRSESYVGSRKVSCNLLVFHSQGKWRTHRLLCKYMMENQKMAKSQLKMAAALGRFAQPTN